jgi:glycopeptide antibiotics resistance protein
MHVKIAKHKRVITLKAVKKTTNKQYGYATAVVLAILLGLASRRYGDFLPVFIAENAGDTLWAMMVYFGFRFLLVDKRPSYSFWLSILFSYGIELSQLYQAEWVNLLRSTTLGALVLGRGFLMVDLVRYTVGILIAASVDKWVHTSHSKRRDSF